MGVLAHFYFGPNKVMGVLAHFYFGPNKVMGVLAHFYFGGSTSPDPPHPPGRVWSISTPK